MRPRSSGRAGGAKSRETGRNVTTARSRRRVTIALIGLIVLAVGGWLLKDALADDPAPQQASSAGGLPVVALSTLPPEAADTWRTVQAGGPYAFPGKDGTVFGNRERLLPAKEPGHYREYTVRTPGSKDRGERRLVVGGPGELYYTGDHYQSFVAVDPNR